MSQPAETATPPPTRYRYFTVAPRTLDLPADVLLSSVPADALTGRTPTHSITVTCSDIFRTNAPRVSSRRLREWLPDAIAPDAQLPEWLPLPVSKVTRAYHPETRREALPNPEQPDANLQPISAPPPIQNPKSKIQNSSWKRIRKPVLGPSVEELQERHDRLRNPPPEAVSETKPQSEIPALNPSEPSAPPIPPSSPPPAAQKTKSEIDPAKIAILQELFHTDGDLTLQDVADLAGNIPGLEACVLTVGEDLRASRNVPNGFDVREIRDRLLSVLASAPAETTRHGAPRTPALTLYFKDGPLSILRHGSSSLLVVHGERAFLPGVRKTLSLALETLEAPSQSPLSS